MSIFHKIQKFILLTIIFLMVGAGHAQSRLKDLVTIEGVRENQLVGYGLVVGLNGNGDNLSSSIFTKESIIGMLERLGINSRDKDLKTQNVAAVIVSATLPPFAQSGDKLDINVSSIGNAKSIVGGTLLVTPLLGADGNVYAVAQGPVTVPGYSAAGVTDNRTNNVPTSGRILNGALIEREIPFDFRAVKKFHLSLRQPDFTTARRVSSAINALIGLNVANVVSPGSVGINVPDDYQNGAVGLATDFEQLRIEVDTQAKVVIDEKSGTIVMGKNVRIDNVIIAQGNIQIQINKDSVRSALARFNAEVFGDNAPKAEEGPKDTTKYKLGELDTGVALEDMVRGLNALGVTPRELISILQTIKNSGALHANLVIM